MCNRLREPIGRSPVIAFFVLTFLLSWVVWLPFAAFDVPQSTLTTALFLVGGFGPAVAGGLMTWLLGDDIRAWIGQLLRWRVALRYWGVAFLLPAAIMVIAGTIGIAAFGAEPTLPTVDQLMVYPVVMAFVFLAGGGNEEPGWRGFALPRLQADYSALTASLIVGVGWATWHLPLFFIPWSSQASLPFVLWATAVLAQSVIFTWFYNTTGGSVLLPMVLHASVNNSTIFYLAGRSQAVATELGYGIYTAVLIVAAVALIGLYGSDRLADGPIPTGPAGRRG